MLMFDTNKILPYIIWKSRKEKIKVIEIIDIDKTKSLKLGHPYTFEIDRNVSSILLISSGY